MKIELKRTNKAFGLEATNEEGLSIFFDANPSIGGSGTGMRPMEALLASLASCASIDVLLIMKKKRIQLSAFEVLIHAKRKEAVPAVFESIHLQFLIGEKDPLELVEKAASLSLNTYCSVAASLSPEIQITHEVIRQEK